ncbi:uncharacterized protein si:dkey-93h22.7 isoform X4 [Gadus morhua]|uniref:uncharacterized protein si:dkey-93h22.7 isoform X4 n=1 Tax=Gadus morhua TaxID=8049 RepID=UPI0011B50F0E|nr:uncharacterized protein LOC115539734 isoform X4 [Gadus morhua]
MLTLTWILIRIILTSRHHVSVLLLEMFSSLVVAVLGFFCFSLETNASPLGPPLLYGPDVALDGHVVEFGCRVLRPPGEPLLLQLFRQGLRSRALAFYTSLDGSPAVFPMVVRRASHEGNLECVASVQNNSRIQPSVSPPHRLKVLVPVGGATLAIRSREEEFFEGERLVLSCNVTSGNYVSYSWLLDDQPPPGPTPQPGPAPHHTHPDLLIPRAGPQHSGSYVCVASNRYNDTEVYRAASPKVMITVKELASRPDLSYAVEKQNQTFSARVTCLSSRGTPPITFSLLGGAVLLARQTSEQGPSASFSVPLVPDAPPRRLRCRAENGGRVADGTETAVHVAPVGGPVTLTYEYITAEDFSVTAVTFFCRVAKGSHPRFQWFLNGTLLGPDAPAFYTLLQPSARQSVLLLPVDRRSSGTYHCRVSDLYDNTTGVPSGKLYLDREALNRLSSAVVAMVFSCFGLVIACVSACCCAGLICRRRQERLKPTWTSEVKGVVLAFEEDLDWEEYREQAEGLTAAGLESHLEALASEEEEEQRPENRETQRRTRSDEENTEP